MNWVRKGQLMLMDMFQRRELRQIHMPTGPIPITPEHTRQEVLEKEAEMKRRLAYLLADAEVPRQRWRALG